MFKDPRLHTRDSADVNLMATRSDEAIIISMKNLGLYSYHIFTLHYTKDFIFDLARAS